MDYEMRRIASFKYLGSLLTSLRFSPLSLAKAGYFVDEKKEIMTFCCKVTLNGVSDVGDPLELHRRTTPKCWFLNDQKRLTKDRTCSFNGVARGTDSEETVSNKNGELKLLNGSNRNSGHSQSNIYTPPDSIKNHLNRSSESQDFLQLMKSEAKRLDTFFDFPEDSPVSKQDLAEAGFFYLGSSDRTKCCFCKGVLRDWRVGEVPRIEHARHLSDCPFVKGEDVGNIAIVTDANQLKCETEVNQQHIERKGQTTEEFKENNSEKNIKDENVSELEEENTALKETRLCKVCLDEQVNTVFLPCGHLVTCNSCASRLHKCPICRDVIKGTVKAFLS